MGKTIRVNAAFPRFLMEQTALLTRRMAAMGAGIDGPRRNINTECQYPEEITIEMYWEMYSREGYGGKVVDSLPNECFTSSPEIKENERRKVSPMERGWYDLEDSDVAPVNWLHEIDKRSGVGRFGGLLYGLDDGMSLDTKARGIKDDGTDEDGPKPKRKLNFLRAFGEGEIRIAEKEGNISNPRYGKPTLYEVLLDSDDVNDLQARSALAAGKWHQVHWTRILHVADNCGPGENYGMPRQQRVWNRLVDIRKILGGDGEMFWKAGSPGLAITADSNLLEAGTVEVDEDSIKEQLKLYQEGLQKFLILVGSSANTLAPNISDPGPHVLVHLNAIACALDQPLRIFTGSEEAKVASGHDMQSHARRVARRQNNYLSKRLFLPFLTRLIQFGVLAKTERLDSNGRPRLKIVWPPITQPTADEQSTVADRFADAILKYTQARGHEMIQPSDFWRFICGLDQDVIDEIMSNIKQAPEIKFTDPSPPPGGDTGVAGKPNSDPKPKTVK